MKEEHKKSYIFFKSILGTIFKLYYNPKIIGADNIPKEGAFLVCGNHLHIMDQCSVMISTKRMIHYMAKKEYFDGKYAWFFKSCGCISVNRQIHDTEAKNHAIDLLKQGYAVGLFPEGTRNKTEKKLLPFKYGAVSMASKTDSYIVPFGISGDYVFRSKNLTIRIGTPFKVTGMDLEKANELLKNKILALMENK